VFDWRRVIEDLRVDPLRTRSDEPSVSEDCETGREFELLWLNVRGDVCEFPRFRALVIGERRLLKIVESKCGDFGVVGLLIGG
jgi:hypothetical protein